MVAKSKGKRARASAAAACSAQFRGPAVFKNGGDTYYETAVLRSSGGGGGGGSETRVCVGDFVSVLVQNGHKEALSVAVVESMWEDREGAKKFEARWFDFAQDVKLSAEHTQEPGELYETDQVDENELESIDSSVQVLTRTIFKQLEQTRAAARSQRRGLDDDSDEEGGPSGDEDRPESASKRPRRVRAPDLAARSRGRGGGGGGGGGGGDDGDSSGGASPSRTPRGEKRAFFCSSFLDRELLVLSASQLLQNRSRRRAYLHSPRLRDANLQSALNVALLKDGRAAGEASKASKRSNIAGCLEGGAGGGDSSAPLDRFARALAQLQLSAVPPSMPCRETERAGVLEFTADGLRKGGGGSLYISGMPGTGKTATVREVVRQLQASAAFGKLPAFDFVELNALRMRHPYDAYTELLLALTGRRVEHRRAAQELERMFSRGEGGAGGGCGSSVERRRPCLLLMDELDHMVTVKQTVLYNLFDWPTRPGSWLTCVSISNTMDLPERLLPRIHSRMGMTRVVFKPYRAQQVEQIVQARLTGLEVGLFDDAAVAFAAKKVAAVSGDIRRALDFCRKAVQCCRAAEQPTVTIEHVQAASRDTQEGANKLALRHACALDKVLCIALRKRLRQQDSVEVRFDDLLRTAMGLWNDLHARMSLETPRLERHHALARVDCLVRGKLLHAEQAHGDRSPVLRLGCELQDEDIPEALAEDPLMQPFFAMDFEPASKPPAAPKARAAPRT